CVSSALLRCPLAPVVYPLSLHDALPIFSAFVKLKPGAVADEAGIEAHCRKHLGGFQVPKLVRILEEMPMTATGKLRKVELRQQRSEEHTSELQSRFDLVCRLMLEKKKKK